VQIQHSTELTLRATPRSNIETHKRTGCLTKNGAGRQTNSLPDLARWESSNISFDILCVMAGSLNLALVRASYAFALAIGPTFAPGNISVSGAFLCAQVSSR
jgi:hypothetical protein